MPVRSRNRSGVVKVHEISSAGKISYAEEKKCRSQSQTAGAGDYGRLGRPAAKGLKVKVTRSR